MEPLLAAPPVYRQTAWRWHVLVLFALSNCNQCLAWFSFNSTDMGAMRAFFGDRMDKPTLDLFLNWGPIVGVAFFPVQTWLLSRRHGLQRGIWAGMMLLLLGNVVRCLPLLGSFHQTPAAFVCYHAGQIAIAAAGPFFMGATTRLSVVWFGERERTTATAIATTANGLGTTIGFLNPLWLAPTPQQIPNIFWLSLALSVVPVVMGCIYLPPGPPTPANAAATAEVDEHPQAADADETPRVATARKNNVWCRSLGAAATNRSFLLLVVGASVLSGVASGWQGLLQSILGDGAGISPTGVSWIGFGNGLAGNVAALVAGQVMDRCFQRRLKLGILVGLFGCFLCQLWFMLQLPCVLWPGGGGGAANRTNRTSVGWGMMEDGVFGMSSLPPPLPPPLPRSETALVTALTLAGFFQGLTSPLFYELSAELIFPVKEGMSAGILVLLLNASAMVVILCNNSLQGGSMNLIMSATVLSVGLLVGLFVREEYRRPQDGDVR